MNVQRLLGVAAQATRELIALKNLQPLALPARILQQLAVIRSFHSPSQFFSVLRDALVIRAAFPRLHRVVVDAHPPQPHDPSPR